MFRPSKPIIFGKVEACEAAEAKLGVDDLVRKALMGTERIIIESNA